MGLPAMHFTEHMNDTQDGLLSLDILRSTDDRFSRINTEEAAVVDRINDALLWGAMQYVRRNGFLWLDVPTLTKVTGACENVNTLYAVDHFGTRAYLAQTGQLYLESKMPLHEKLWTIIDSSRAEAAVDDRHLNQFKLFEIEHRGTLDDLIANAEGIVKSMFFEALQTTGADLERIGRYDEVSQWAEEEFGRVTYTEAIRMLSGTAYQVAWGVDFTSEQEAEIVRQMGNKPTFITHYPLDIKFFNMRQNDDNPRIVNSTDLIMPYSGESMGAAERENRPDLLRQRLLGSKMFAILSSMGVGIDEFEDYLGSAAKSPLHSGFGLGMPRLSQAVLGEKTINAGVPYPIKAGGKYLY